jgi:hypothetical protein
MHQRSICVFLAMERLSTQVAYGELVAGLGLNAIASPRITKYLRQRQFIAISSPSLTNR